MKYNLRSKNEKYEIMRLSSVKSKTLVKNYWVFYAIKKNIFLLEKYTNANVCTIRVGNKKLFWVIMYDVEEEIRIKNMSDLVRKEICSILRTKNPTKDQIRKYKRREKEWS